MINKIFRQLIILSGILGLMLFNSYTSPVLCESTDMITCPNHDETISESESYLGRAVVVAVDGPDGSSYDIVSRTESGDLVELALSEHQRQQVLTRVDGMSGRLHRDGQSIEDNAAPETSVSDFATLTEAEGGDATYPVHYAPALGPRKAAAFLVNYVNCVSEPATPTEIQALFDGVIKQYFEESSFNQVEWSTDVYGWWTLPEPDNGYQLANDAKAEAKNRGIDLTQYDHLIILYPNCGKFGCACGTVGPGGNGTQVVWRCVDEDFFDINEGVETTVHELGHNLGFWHGRRLDCGTETLGEDCTAYHYGDYFDPMGGSMAVLSHFHAFHKERVGWIRPEADAPARIENVRSSGTYTISPYSLALNGSVKALKIRRGSNPGGGVDYFYLEYRQPIGFDTELHNMLGDVFDGIFIRMGNDTFPDSSDLLDMSPEDRSMGSFALKPGQTFSDSMTGVTIAIDLLSIDTAGAVVNLTIPSNYPPVAVADTASTYTPRSVTIFVLANDSDPEGDTLQLVSAECPNNGSVVVNADGTLTYRPNKKFIGTDSFNYWVSDSHVPTKGTVTVYVNERGKK